MPIDSIWSVHSGKPHTPDARHIYEQLSGVANGLCFLHDNRLVHGDLRPVGGALFPSMRSNIANRVTYLSMTTRRLD